jgi:hypothetical protein
MGNAIAIANYKWSKFIVEGSLYINPMGLEIINSIDIRLDGHWVRSVYVYFMCTSVEGDLAVEDIPPGQAGCSNRILSCSCGCQPNYAPTTQLP